jgi:hypothetical protein
MMRDPEISVLHDIVQCIYDSHAARASVHPAWLANEVMQVIGFPRELHELGYQAAHLHFRQIARSYCRKRFDPAERSEADLFPETLQQRYPRAAPGFEEPEYVLLELMEPRDIAFNVARLRKEAKAKLKHADALEAWGVRKFGKIAA